MVLSINMTTTKVVSGYRHNCLIYIKFSCKSIDTQSYPTVSYRMA